MARPRLRDVRRAVKKNKRSVSGKDLQMAWGASGLSRLGLVLWDPEYTGVDRKTWEKILAWSNVDRHRYETFSRDCDNFAIALAGQLSLRLGINGVGIVVDYSGCHAYCALLVVDDDGVRIAVVEPQSDGFISMDQGRHQMYAAQNGVVLWS